jgi:putative hydrolase of the HAD superfamily
VSRSTATPDGRDTAVPADAYDALLLDIGDVIVGLPAHALDAFEATTGRRVPGRGPYGPADDPLWQRRLAGELTIEEYWQVVAGEAGFASWRDLFRAASDVVADEMFDQDALALMADARRAGKRVGVLSNDAYSINGPEFFAARPEFAELDAFVDSTDVGFRKPAAEAYLAAAKALDVEPERVVFLDDTPACVDGARAVGMAALQVDPGDRRPAFTEARALLGLA